MKYNKKLLLKRKSAIKCDNFEEFKIVVNAMRVEGIKDLPNDLKKVWDFFHEKIIICVTSHSLMDYKSGGFDDIKYFKKKNYIILPFRIVFNTKTEYITALSHNTPFH
jgi:hypothetical protein